MLIEYIAAFAAAFVGAGVAMLARHITRGAVPRSAIPVLAGMGMLGFTIWGEYAWYGRTANSLPADVVVVQTHAEPSSFRPWTYVKPFVSRFMAVDRAAVRTNADVPDQKLAEVLLFTHRGPAAKVPVLVDCLGQRRADISDGMTFDAVGAVTDATWHDMAGEDPLLAAVCS